MYSSGDHRSPPPAAEHAGLRVNAAAKVSRVVALDDDARRIVGDAMVHKLEKMNRHAHAIAVGREHVHLLVYVWADDAKLIARDVKRAASHAVRERLPGTIWARGCAVKRCNDEAHVEAAKAYVLRHTREGAWVWGG